jgi:hypothetical protein
LYGFKHSIIAQYVTGRDNFKFLAHKVCFRAAPGSDSTLVNAARGLPTFR